MRFMRGRCYAGAAAASSIAAMSIFFIAVIAQAADAGDRASSTRSIHGAAPSRAKIERAS
jgi:hypothetical protein